MGCTEVPIRLLQHKGKLFLGWGPRNEVFAMQSSEQEGDGLIDEEIEKEKKGWGGRRTEILVRFNIQFHS